MTCNSCGEKRASKLVVRITAKGERSEYCDRCGNVSLTWIPDVYWPGHSHTSANITDRMGIPIPLESRQQKARIMRAQGISEAGDRVHGSYIGTTVYQSKDWRERIHEQKLKLEKRGKRYDR